MLDHHDISACISQIIFNKNSILTLKQLTISRKEKIFAKITSLIDGIGFAGLITAAFWYATAPMAPDGFTGPISSLTIAISTIVSLVIAIPIAQNAYKKMVNLLNKEHAELFGECLHLNQHYEELIVILLRLRCLFKSDDDFKIYLTPLYKEHRNLLKLSTAQVICAAYAIFEKKKYIIQWQLTNSFKPIFKRGNGIGAQSIIQLMHNHQLLNIAFFRKETMYVLKKLLPMKNLFLKTGLNALFNNLQNNNSLIKDLFMSCLIPAITCSEVLLGIFWTIFSIFIGLHIILPISNDCWIFYILFCSLSGI